MRKKLFFLILLVLFCQTVFSLSPQEVINNYNEDKISAPKLIVYLEHIKFLSENETIQVPERLDTKDFYIRFENYDETFDFKLVPKENVKIEDVSGKIIKLKDDIATSFEKNNVDFKELYNQYEIIKKMVKQLDHEKCINIMSKIMDKSDEGYQTIILGSENKDEYGYDQSENIKLIARCDKNIGSIIVLSNLGHKYEKFVRNFYSPLTSQGCTTPMLEAYIQLRKIFQKDMDKEFISWYAKDFLDSKNKFENAEDNFERLMITLNKINEKVMNDLSCKSDKTWPKEFKKIKLDYKKNNIEFHIWEEMSFVKDKNMEALSTFYRYKIMPPKNIAKKLIKKEVLKKGINPDIDELRSQEKFMEVVDILSNKFGGSLDLKLVLKDNKETMLEKIITINHNDVVLISDNNKEELDFTATLELDNLYNFVNQIMTLESRETEGSYWVEKEDNSLSISEGIGTALNLWKTVSIKPWTTKIKLMFSIRKVVSLIRKIEESENSKETKQEEPKPLEISSPDSDSIEFKVDLIHPGGNTRIHYLAKNIKSPSPDFKIISEGTETIILGSEKKGWTKHEGSNKWDNLLKRYDWEEAWDMYYTNQFSRYLSKVKSSKEKEISISSKNSDVRIYDINRKKLADNIFSID